jgi:hypothetical protein
MAYTNSRDKNVQLIMEQVSPILSCLNTIDFFVTINYCRADSLIVFFWEQIQLDNEIPDEEVISFISESQANLFLLNNPNMTTAGK